MPVPRQHEPRAPHAAECHHRCEHVTRGGGGFQQDTEPRDRVLGAARHLLVLINDILDLSKIEAGRMELQIETFPLAPLIADVVKTIEPLAGEECQ